MAISPNGSLPVRHYNYLLPLHYIIKIPLYDFQFFTQKFVKILVVVREEDIRTSLPNIFEKSFMLIIRISPGSFSLPYSLARRHQIYA
jgi:hypothetical protein